MSEFAHEKLLRAPYLQTRPGTDTPLTVLCSLLARADSNFGLEHWGEYWRKVHGVRLTHTEASDDVTLDRLQRYDQLHRFAQGPTNTDAPPYRIPVDADGKLWPTILDHVEAYRRPRWDGIAYLGFEHVDDIATVFANERVRTKIVPEDVAMFRDIAPILARQHIVIPVGTSNEAVTLVKLHVRRAQDSRAAFQQWWLDVHAGLYKTTAEGSSYVKRYVQLHNVGPVVAGQPFYHAEAARIDGVSLLAFASVNDLEEFLLSPAYRDIAQQEAAMTDAASQWWTAIGMVIVNRIHPEVASRPA